MRLAPSGPQGPAVRKQRGEQRALAAHDAPEGSAILRRGAFPLALEHRAPPAPWAAGAPSGAGAGIFQLLL